jgi:hypothetical protein
MTRVRLTRKFANRLNGVDLSTRRVGEVLTLQSDAAWILINEGWAELWIEPPAADTPDAKDRPPSSE